MPDNGNCKLNVHAQEGPGPAMIFIHGAGGSGKVWWKQLAALKGLAYCLAVDLPGHGESEGKPFSTISETVDFLAGFISRLSLGKVVLVGHSMGGAIAQEFALKYPEHLAGIVLVATGCRLRVAPQILETLGRGEFPFNGPGLLFAPGAPQDAVEDAWQEMQKVEPAVFLSDFKACDAFNRAADIPQINLPTLIVVGDQDVMTPVKYSGFLQENIAGSSLEVIPGAGHMVMLEAPGAVNKAVVEFLQQIKH